MQPGKPARFRSQRGHARSGFARRATAHGPAQPASPIIGELMRAASWTRAYSHSSAGRPRRSRMAPRHVGRTRRQVLRGGETPPRDPPPPQQREHGAERPVPSGATAGATAGAAARAGQRPRRKRASGAAQSGPGPQRRRMAPRPAAWRRPACGGWPSLAGIGGPSRRRGRRATLARDRAPPREAGCAPQGRAGAAARHRGRRPDPPGAPPLDRAGGSGPRTPRTRPGASPWTPPRRA